MSSSFNDTIDVLSAELHRHGVTNFTIEPGGKHPRLRAVLREREITLTFSGSPSDCRSQRNAIADLRRMMRAHGIDKKKAEKGQQRKSRRRLRRPEALPPLPAMTARPDPLEVLRRLLPVDEPCLIDASDSVVGFASTGGTPISGGDRQTHASIRLRTPWLGQRLRWQEG